MEAIRKALAAFSGSTSLMKIVWINLGVFVLLRLCAIVGVFSGRPGLIDSVLPWVELPSSLYGLLRRPWTLVTYMFSQWDLLHVAFNMLWLYWFGTIFRMRCNSRQLVTLYFYGGIAGAALFILGYSFLPLFHGTAGYLIGSSASVIAIVTAVAILMPHFKMNLFLIGSVSVKWIAIVTIVLVLVGVTGNNAGGEIAHLGGVAAGALFALRLRSGRDITAPFEGLGGRLRQLMRPTPVGRGRKAQSQPQSRQTAAQSPGGLNPDERRELDIILDKIKKSGYSSLTTAERDRLFSVSSKIK